MKEVKLNLAQVKRHEVIKMTLQGQMTNQDAANVLKLSVRQIQRLKRRVEKEGALGVIHKNTARKPWNAIPPPTKETIIELAMTGYSGYNFCHLSEMLY